jgi:hypothetical protein
MSHVELCIIAFFLWGRIQKNTFHQKSYFCVQNVLCCTSLICVICSILETEGGSSKDELQVYHNVLDLIFPCCMMCCIVLQLWSHFDKYNTLHKYRKYDLRESDILEITEEVCGNTDIFNG